MQAPLTALRTALAAAGVNAESQETTTSTACCPLCLGILQDADGVGHAAIAEVAAAARERGYELREGERRLAFALCLSLPYCEALRTRACWCVCYRINADAAAAPQPLTRQPPTRTHREWLAACIGPPPSSLGLPLEVKEIARAAVEEGVARQLGLRADVNGGELRVLLNFLHPAADQADYEGAVKVCERADSTVVASRLAG